MSQNAGFRLCVWFLRSHRIYLKNFFFGWGRMVVTSSSTRSALLLFSSRLCPVFFHFSKIRLVVFHSGENGVRFSISFFCKKNCGCVRCQKYGGVTREAADDPGSSGTTQEQRKWIGLISFVGWMRWWAIEKYFDFGVGSIFSEFDKMCCSPILIWRKFYAWGKKILRWNTI